MSTFKELGAESAKLGKAIYETGVVPSSEQCAFLDSAQLLVMRDVDFMVRLRKVGLRSNYSDETLTSHFTRNAKEAVRLIEAFEECFPLLEDINPQLARDMCEKVNYIKGEEKVTKLEQVS